MSSSIKRYGHLFILACLFVSVLASCGTKLLPLKGAYTNELSISIQNGNRDSIWSRLIDFCSRQGLSIKVIDKNSGLLTFEKMELRWTYEDDSTFLPRDSSAWVILPKLRQGIVIARPTQVFGEWSVRLQEKPGGKCSLTTNLVYVKYITVYQGRNSKRTRENIPQAYTTGILEKLLFTKVV